MKTNKSFSVNVSGLQMCGASGIEINGKILRPDEDNAMVEFYICHAYPVIRYRTGLHPQVVENSAPSLLWKVFNLAHIMHSYNPEEHPVDRMLGTIIAVEFPSAPEGGWKLQPDKNLAPGIRAVAVMHKAAQGVNEILELWSEGKTVLGDGDWSVSIENSHTVSESGFIVRGRLGVESFEEDTPADLLAMGFTYVPLMSAPAGLLRCINNDEDDRADKIISTRIKRDFRNQEVILFLGGLNGRIRLTGTGLTPVGAEEEARVSRMLASAPMIDVNAAVKPLHDLAAALKDLKVE